MSNHVPFVKLNAIKSLGGEGKYESGGSVCDLRKLDWELFWVFTAGVKPRTLLSPYCLGITSKQSTNEEKEVERLPEGFLPHTFTKVADKHNLWHVHHHTKDPGGDHTSQMEGRSPRTVDENIETFATQTVLFGFQPTMCERFSELLGKQKG